MEVRLDLLLHDRYRKVANGNMTHDGVNAGLVYDAENRLTAAAGAAFTFDSGPMRVKKVLGGEVHPSRLAESDFMKFVMQALPPSAAAGGPAERP
jgi:hypothetical protein